MSSQKNLDFKNKGFVKLLFSISFVLMGFSIFSGFVSAAPINNSFHLNIQTTFDNGTIQAGTFQLMFNLTDNSSSNCVGSLDYNHSFGDVDTDSRGIVSLYLPSVGSGGGDLGSLNFDQQYYICYYRDGTLKSVSQLGRVPYSFRTDQVNVSELNTDSNFDTGDYNISGSWGFFDFLGSAAERITKLFVQDVNASGDVDVGGDLAVTGGVTRAGKPLVDWSEVTNGTLSTTADILAFGYYNSTDFVITDYFTKTELENFGYYNSTDFSISDYFTSAQVLAFDYYNSTDFDIANYITSATLLGYNYYNSTDFSISDYFTSAQVLAFDYYNSTDFDINDYVSAATVLGWNYYNSTDFDISDYYTSAQILGFNYYNETTLDTSSFGNLSGSGSSGYLSKFTAAGILGSSVVYDDGTNIGIGTASPSAATVLTLRTSATNSNALSLLNRNANQQWSWNVDYLAVDDAILTLTDNTGSTNPFIVESDTPTNTLYLNSSGNVGIGTTTPQNTFNVIGSGNFTGNTTSQVDFCIEGGNCLSSLSSGGGSGSITGGGTQWYIPLWNGTSSLNNSNIYQSGSNIGIGTTAPSGKLSVASADIGSAWNFAGGVTWDNKHSVFGPNAGTTTGAAVGIGYSTTLDKGYLYSISPTVAWKPLVFGALNFTFLSAGQETIGLFQSSTAQVGIGTTTPQNKLNVVGGDLNVSDTGGTPYVYIGGGYIYDNGNALVLGHTPGS